MHEEVARNAFLLGIGGQVVSPRQIRNVQTRAVTGKHALLALDSLSRPVAYMLIEAGQQIEDG